MNVQVTSGQQPLPLVDIRNVHIDTTLPQQERICSFIEQVKDPYHFRVGDVVVNVSYSGTGTLNDRFTQMMSLLE